MKWECDAQCKVFVQYQIKSGKKPQNMNDKSALLT